MARRQTNREGPPTPDEYDAIFDPDPAEQIPYYNKRYESHLYQTEQEKAQEILVRKTENGLATPTFGPTTPVTRQPTNKMRQRHHLPSLLGPIDPKVHIQLLRGTLRPNGDRQRPRTTNLRLTYQYPTRLRRKLPVKRAIRMRRPLETHSRSSYPCKKNTIRDMRHRSEDPKSTRRQFPTMQTPLAATKEKSQDMQPRPRAPIPET